MALIAGFAMASISLTTTTQNASGNYVNASGAVTGVTYTSTVLGATSNPAPAASTGSAGAPQVVVAGANAFCANTCTVGDFAQIVTYTFTTSMTGSIQISIQVTASAGGGAATLYLKQAGTAVAGTIVLTWDVGSSSATLTAVTLGLQQCSGATCP
ncbi:MAG: hypothetical protein L3K15_00245 [Thermoplasmata archaeon]|nr:hypothetical protein [Thermoplasmata archaeon]